MSQTPPLGLAFPGRGQFAAYLHIHEELPEVSWGKHNGGVELDDIALVQGDVVVGGETLTGRGIRQPPCKAEAWTGPAC